MATPSPTTLDSATNYATSAFSNFLNPVPTPTGNQPPQVTPTPTTISTSKPAITQVSGAKTLLDQTTAGIQQQNQIRSQNLDPVMAAATSDISYDKLLATNPAAAFARSFGHAPSSQELATFQAQNAPETPALDQFTNAINGGTTQAQAEANGFTNNGLPIPPGMTVAGYTDSGQPIFSPSSPASSNSTGDPYTDALRQMNQQNQQKYDDMTKQIADIQNGNFQLNPGQLAQIQDIQNVFAKAKEEQAAYNDKFTAGSENIEIASGRNRYAPGVSLGNIQSVVNAGAQKIHDLDAKMLSEINTLKRGFQNDDVMAIRSAYDDFNKFQTQQTATIDKLHAQALAFDKQLKDQKQKELDDTYTRVTLPIENILKDAIANGASSDIIAKIQASQSVDQALTAAGDSLQKPQSGIVGEYQYYLKDAQAHGQTPVDFNTYQNMDANRKAKVAAAGVAGNISVGANGQITGSTGNPVQDISAIIKNAKLGTGTKTNLANVINVVEGASQWAKDTGGTFKGFYPLGLPFVDLPGFLKTSERITNEGTLAALNLKVQQWASGASLTKDQTDMVNEMLPQKNDTDASARVKLNNLVNYMIGQAKGNLASEGIYVEFPKISLFSNSTGNDLINSENQAKEKILNSVKTSPNSSKAIEDMITKGMSYSDIQKVLGIQ